jgi:hypothetical protein
VSKSIRLLLLSALSLALCWTAFADTSYTTNYCSKDFKWSCADQNGSASVGCKWTCSSSTVGKLSCQSPSCSGTCLYAAACGSCGGGGGGCGCYGCCGGCLLMDGD